MKSEKGKIIAVSSFKGGVGKTITVLNLAGAFSKLNKKVLIIDLDLESGNISVALNTKNTKTLYNVVDDLSNNRFKDYKDYTEKYDENIHVINSIKDPRQAKLIDARYIELFLNHVKYKYDIILLDNAHGFSTITLTSLDIADTSLFIMNNDIMDIKVARSSLAIMEDIGKENIKILLNESIKPTNDFFRKSDIENIIKTNINYVLEKKYHIKNINNYILEGKILSLNSNLKKYDVKFIEIAEDLIKER